MPTKKQIAANRANAAKSTGPKTETGKTASSKNATKHGILSQVAIADHEDGNLFASLTQTLMNEYQPQTSSEFILVERLALLFWRERRLAQAEAVEAGVVREAAKHQLTPPSKDVVPVPQARDIRGLKGVLPIEQQMLMGRYQTMLSNQIEHTLASLRLEARTRERINDAALSSLD